MVKLTRSDDFNKYIDDLFSPDSRIEEVVMVPYEETDNLATRREKLLNKITTLGRKQGRIEKLIYYYYIGEELLKYNNYREKWRVVVKEKMFMSEKRHFTNAIRVYKLFKLVNKEKIYNTVYLNSNLIGELSTTDYKKLYDMIENCIIYNYFHMNLQDTQFFS
ncbi:7540_t:CDS:1 [Entrophospora sp. SA101]|nr:7540_t:CDS:1 [Entrophospora sp. SA101]